MVSGSLRVFYTMAVADCPLHARQTLLPLHLMQRHSDWDREALSRCRRVARPAFIRVEGDDPNLAIKLTLDELLRTGTT